MKIPVLQQSKLVDEKGYLTPGWQGVLTELFTQMQQNLSNEGFVPPSQPSTNISQLTQSQNGTLIYDNTTHELKVNINGDFKVVQTA